ncbi:metallophosphoesterase N-terminal domain-containing protein [Alistipes communis]|jgi:hypothetical protein|uniref:metallophosphoesterase N-terminal domain-containing protein n=1 Tax=Alistipes communis TaxID=2585118 RepID=UPI0026670EBB|nr:metallophosphoesterase N-terminal domain-containing protein [Alistipes communis]
MKRFFHTLVALLLLAACTDGNNELGSKDPFSIPDKEGCNVKGTVFDDYGTPLEGIVVSDGLQTTQTDRNGHFWLSSDLSKRRFVTVTVPSGYEIESKEGLPQFFDRIPEGSTSFSTEFRLRSRRGNSNRFTVFMVGDPQIRARDRGYDKFAYHSIDMFEDMCRDMNKLCATMTDRPVYGIGLGDLIHEDANMWEIYRSGSRRSRSRYSASSAITTMIPKRRRTARPYVPTRRILVPRTIRSIWAGSISSVWTTSS